MFLCNIVLTASDFTPITSHIHKWALFSLWLCLFILSGVISPLISGSILGTYQPGKFIFQCPIFLPFMLFMGFSRQEYWSGLPFTSPVDHVLSELSTMSSLFWVALHGMAHSLTELDKAVMSLMWWLCLVFCDCGFHSLGPLMDKDKKLMEAPDGRDWLRGNWLLFMGGVILSKSLIQFSVMGGSVSLPCYFTWGQTMVELMKVIETTSKMSHACTAALSAPTFQQVTANPWLYRRLLDTHGQV